MSKKIRVSRGAMMYLSPWVVWIFLLPLALVFWWMASAGQAAAFVLGGATFLAGGALALQVWGSYSERSNERERIVATATFALAFLWLCAATMFGLFHRPPVDIWPAFWRIPEFLVKAFTLPIWGSWFFLMAFTSIAWNIGRGARRNSKGDDDERSGKTEDQLGKILDGATIKVDAKAGKEDAPVIKATVHGVPGQHTGDELMGKAGALESQYGLRPGAIRADRDYADASKAKLTITPVDPHAEGQKWSGPQHPGTSIADHPCRPAIYTDGEELEHWLPGDDEGGRPLQHLADSGVNGSGKSAGLKITLVEALCRKDVEGFAADISGKIWQTFGPLIPYLSKVAGLNGIEDADREKNILDTKELLLFAETSAMDRQMRWGKLGINQWEPRCFTEFGDAFRILVIEEGSEIIDRLAEDMERIAKKLRSGGWLIVLVAQRFTFDQVPTTLRAQLPARYVFGQGDTRDSSMMLPEDVADILGRSPANDPGTWLSSTPGKAIACVPGQPQSRRADPVRFYWATNAEIAAYLAEHGRRLWSEAEIEGLKNGTVPEGIVVRPTRTRGRTKRPADVRPRAYVRDDDVRDVRDEDTYVHGEDEEAYVHDAGTYVYADPDLEDIDVHGDEPIECPDAYMNVPLAQSGYEPTPDAVVHDTGRFRAIVQQHLTALLAQGKQEIGAADIVPLDPPAGSRQRIRAEFVRLSERGVPTEVTVEQVEALPGRWLIRAPKQIPSQLVSVSG